MKAMTIRRKEINSKGQILNKECPFCKNEDELFMKDFSPIHFDFDIECCKCGKHFEGVFSELDEEAISELIKEKKEPFHKIKVK